MWWLNTLYDVTEKWINIYLVKWIHIFCFVLKWGINLCTKFLFSSIFTNWKERINPYIYLIVMLTLGHPRYACWQNGHVLLLDWINHCARHKRQKLWPQVKVVGWTRRSEQHPQINSDSMEGWRWKRSTSCLSLSLYSMVTLWIYLRHWKYLFIFLHTSTVLKVHKQSLHFSNCN